MERRWLVGRESRGEEVIDGRSAEAIGLLMTAGAEERNGSTTCSKNFRKSRFRRQQIPWGLITLPATPFFNSLYLFQPLS